MQGREHHLTWQTLQPREQRWATLGQRPAIAWLTGLSGAGKSSIADAVDQALIRSGRHSMVIDGDNLRHGLNRDLGFSALDRVENIRRAAETARLMAEAGLIVIVALISPFRNDREAAKLIAGDITFLEVYINTPIDVCEERDPKGLYNQARAGKIQNFTGVSHPYDVPEAPDLLINTQGYSIEQSAAALISQLMRVTALSPVHMESVVRRKPERKNCAQEA
ncbi:adenylyl-sulfate kinase [Methylobacterium brachiatum]|nr:adenylyl-sulfate kinase [Methylobacterium brachiatum]